MEVGFRHGPLLLLGAFVFLGAGLRIVLFWRRTGTWPVVLRFGEEGLLGWTEAYAAVAVGVIGGIVVYQALVPEPRAVLGRLAWLEHPTLAWTGVGLGAAAVAWTWVAQGGMGESWRIGVPDEDTDLVTGGLFAVCRHPIYLGIQASLLAALLIYPTTALALAFLLVAFVVGARAREEEAHLLRRHGEAYRDYGRRVGRFVPWLGRFPPE